eukprot:200906_1
MTNSILLNTMVALIFTHLVFIHAKRYNSFQNTTKMDHNNTNNNIRWTKSFIKGINICANNFVLCYLDIKRWVNIDYNGILAYIIFKFRNKWIREYIRSIDINESVCSKCGSYNLHLHAEITDCRWTLLFGIHTNLYLSSFVCSNMVFYVGLCLLAHFI